MSDAEIAAALRLLDFTEDSDLWTPTLARYRWALREVLRLRALLANKEASE